MEIKGKFFPVGHGLTYAFKVECVNVLFDIRKNCDLVELEKFYGNKNIDILIISHFDADHSDGIHNLYASGFHIRNIYIPYIGKHSETILYFIFLYKNKSYPDIMEEIRTNDTIITEVDEMEEILPLPFWKFNIHQSINAPKHVANIISNLNAIGIKTKDDVRKKLETKQQDIKDAYKKVMYDLNATSLFMEHGPVDDKLIKESDYCGLEFISGSIESEKNVNMHSLITGDCSLLVNKSIISRYVDNLGYVLVPHHSGIKEWDDFICKGAKTAVWIVTISKIGIRPYGLIVSDIYTNKEKLYICDNSKAFEYEFNI